MQQHKQLIIALSIILLLTATSVGALFLSRNKKTTTQIASASPTPTATTEPSPTPTPRPTVTPKPTPSPSPSPKSSPKPSPSPTPTPTPVSSTAVVNSTENLDGYESSNGDGSQSMKIRVGRNTALISRGFVSFTLPSEVSGKTIDSATLRLYQAEVHAEPYAAGGAILVEHVDYGTTMDASDYSPAPIDGNSATLADAEPDIEWKQASVTNAVKADVAGAKPRTQFRLRFTTETVGGNDDFAYFYSSNQSHNTYRPELVIKYH